MALEQARARAVKGEPQATVTLMGVTLLLYGRRDVFPVTIIRQVCGLAARNSLPIHVVTCAYFNALNPLGDRQEKRRVVAAEFSRFDALVQASTPEAATLLDRFQADMDALKACLPGT